MISKLGIIAGNGSLPREIANLYLERGGAVCIAALEGETDISLIAGHAYQQFPIGSAGAIIKYFAQNSVTEVIIIGGLVRPDLRSIKVDSVGAILIAKILKNKFLGDDNLLKVIADFIESKGFKVISPKELLKIGNYKKLYTTKVSPSAQDQIDIQLGKQILNLLGEMDVGQSIITCNGYVLGIEAAEGTNDLITRCALLRKSNKGGVLVKMAKSAQDMRVDLPAIGPDTARHLTQGGYRGIAIAASGVIMIKPQETIDLLNQSNLFISYIIPNSEIKLN